MILVQVYITIILLQMGYVHEGHRPIPTTGAIKASTLLSSSCQNEKYCDCPDSASGQPGVPDDASVDAAAAPSRFLLAGLTEAMRGWWASFVGTGRDLELRGFEADYQPRCLTNVTLTGSSAAATAAEISEQPVLLSRDGEEEDEWKIWRARDYELSIRVPEENIALGSEPDNIQDLLSHLAVVEDKHFTCLSTEAPNEDVLVNATDIETDGDDDGDVTSCLRATIWLAISALMDGFPPQTLIAYFVSAHRLQAAVMTHLPLHATTVPPVPPSCEMLIPIVFISEDDAEIFGVRLLGSDVHADESQIRPGDVLLEWPADPAWVTRAASAVLACVVVCLMCPSDRRDSKEATKAMKRRRRNARHRSSRRFASFMNAKKRQ